MVGALGQQTRLFDVDEADRVLPLVRSIVRGMMEDWEERRRVLERLESMPDEPGADRDDDRDDVRDDEDDDPDEPARALHAEVDALTEKLVEAAEELAELGVEFKGIEEGLVDFPARMGDELVYLCWKHGEDRVQWWHPLDAGYAGRRPLDRD